MKQSNGSTSASNTIADLYTAPDQISAYIGAVNSNKQFDWLKDVCGFLQFPYILILYYYTIIALFTSFILFF